jgi:LPXTG-motif cell wall-anchored protein
VPENERSHDDQLATHPRRLRRRAAAALFAFGVASGAMAGPAAAAQEPVSTPVTGSFTTAVSSVDLAGTIFQGTWDGATGEFAGKFVFPTTDVSVTSPSAATISLVVQQPTESTGTVDLGTNAATFNVDLVLELLTIDIGIGAEAVFDCKYAMPVSLAGSYDPGTGVIQLSQTGFSLSAIDAANPQRCFWNGTGTSLASIIDPVIVGSTNSLAATFDLGIADAAPPPPPPPPPPAVPPAAPAAADPAPVVADVSVNRQLPRTGGSENAVLAVVGVGLVGLGSLALSASQPARRRRATSAR